MVCVTEIKADIEVVYPERFSVLKFLSYRAFALTDLLTELSYRVDPAFAGNGRLGSFADCNTIL